VDTCVPTKLLSECFNSEALLPLGSHVTCDVHDLCQRIMTDFQTLLSQSVLFQDDNFAALVDGVGHIYSFLG
jgi:hypothetical protein